MPDEVKEFLKLLPDDLWKERYFELIGEQCYLMPEYKLPKKLRYLRTGIQFGTFKKGRFEPAHALALWLRDCRCTQDHGAESKEIAAYLHGDVVPSTCKGWCLVTVDGYSLGWGKGDGTVLKNHYPKGLRRLN